MKIDIRFRGIARTAEDVNYTEKRLRFALGRIAAPLARVRVTIADVNGPHGGVDKWCQIVFHEGTVGTLRVAATSEDVRTAVDTASHRLARAVGHAVERRREFVAADFAAEEFGDDEAVSAAE
jgi:putative sigma-54 modulation protein